MARRALVQVQRGHPAQEPAGQIVGVVPEDPRPPPIGTALGIAAARLVLRAVGRIGLDHQRGARQAVEIARGKRLHLARDFGIAARQFLLAGGVKARIGADVLEKGLEIARIAQPVPHGVHLALDSLDFA